MGPSETDRQGVLLSYRLASESRGLRRGGLQPLCGAEGWLTPKGVGAEKGSGSGSDRIRDQPKMLLPLVWGFWCLTALMQGRTTASAAFLPPSVERLFKEFRNIFEQSREDVLGKDQLEPSVDISKLPSNYHNEEKHQRKVGNATVYSHREISKMTDNRTGEMVFSEKTVTSIEQADARPEEEEEDEEKKPVASQDENGAEADRESTGLRFLKLGPPQPRPRLTFLIFRLPQHLKSKPIPEANWEKEEPATDRRHRLLAIRNGLLTAPHPIKKKALPVTPNRKLLPRKHHFLFFWRKI
uniref:dickkopf-like protein 1 isoform X4 n=1 Tax=Podarcis muralis TaxID=64176 RepID=UPI0010A05D5E|nr:dickkopf-like protein 1 isoform X4 [Podarcis muralis]